MLGLVAESYWVQVTVLLQSGSLHAPLCVVNVTVCLSMLLSHKHQCLWLLT